MNCAIRRAARNAAWVVVTNTSLPHRRTARTRRRKPDFRKRYGIPGGLISKLVALTDRAGRIARFSLNPGNAYEIKAVPGLVEGVSAGRFLANRAYDSKALRADPTVAGIDVVIPAKRNAKVPADYDMDAYKARHLVENAFAGLNQFRGVATRYCKLAVTFTAKVGLCAFVVNTRATRRGPHRIRCDCSQCQTANAATRMAVADIAAAKRGTTIAQVIFCPSW